MKAYNVEVRISKQEDGLWRAEVPGMPGCFVDASTVSDALHEIQEVAAMFIDLLRERGAALPDSLHETAKAQFTATLPLVTDEHKFKRPSTRSRARTSVR